MAIAAFAVQPAPLTLLLGALGLAVLVLAGIALSQHRFVHSSHWLPHVMRHTQDGIMVFSVAGRIVYISRIAKTMLGLPSGGIHLRQIESGFECFNADGSPLPFRAWPICRALRADFVHDEQIYFKNLSNGVLCSNRVTSSAVHDRRGRLKRVALIFHHDTDPHRAKEQLSRVNAIVQGSGDGIFSRDLSGIVDNWNAGASEIYGYTAAEMVGRTIEPLLLPHDVEIEREILDRVIRSGSVHRYRSVRRRSDGRSVEVAITCSPTTTAYGSVFGVSNISRDVTREAEIEDQRRQSQKLAAIGQLTGGIAHDFNNLLGIIIGNLELLEREAGDAVIRTDAIRDRALAARIAASRAADLTRRLLAFSSQQHLQPGPIVAAEAVSNVIQLVTRALGPDISITTNFDDSLAPILVDPSGLENALLNLALNARDAMPQGGTLHFATARVQLDAELPAIAAHVLEPGLYACISVTDTGVGMSPTTTERAFDPFFTTKPLGQGTGLGLAMVYGFAKQSNGTARIYSELGTGTTISLYLRFAHTAIVPAPDPVIHPPSPSAGACILLVDDEHGLLQVASTFLDQLGYRVIKAGDGPAALRAFANHPGIDLVVTDILMPGGLSGFELVHRIHELSPGTHCLYTSGFPSNALAGKPFRPNECAMLQKPYRLTELAAAVEKALPTQLSSAQPPPYTLSLTGVPLQNPVNPSFSPPSL